MWASCYKISRTQKWFQSNKRDIVSRYWNGRLQRFPLWWRLDAEWPKASSPGVFLKHMWSATAVHYYYNYEWYKYLIEICCVFQAYVQRRFHKMLWCCVKLQQTSNANQMQSFAHPFQRILNWKQPTIHTCPPDRGEDEFRSHSHRPEQVAATELGAEISQADASARQGQEGQQRGQHLIYSAAVRRWMPA